MAKNIIIFSTNYFPFVGGAEVAIKEITDRIPSTDMPFDMVVPKYTKSNLREEKIGNVMVYRVGLGVWFDKFLIPFLGCKKAVQLNKEKDYSTIWVMMASQASIAGAKFKKKFPNKKLVLTLQEGDEEEYLKRYVFGNDFLYKILVKPFYMKVFRIADEITAISNYLRKRAIKNTHNTRVTLVPNGVELKRFRNTGEDLTELKRSLDIKGFNKVIVTTSRLVKKNAVGDIVSAVGLLPDFVKLLVIGSGELESETKTQVKKLNLGNRVIFLGNIEQKDIPQYLHISDIFVRPSLSEGQGISFLEAMAAELPVIATEVGGIPDFLRDRQTGLFCEANNPQSIADAVTELINNPKLVLKLAQNARKMVEERYDWKIVFNKMQEVLNK